MGGASSPELAPKVAWRHTRSLIRDLLSHAWIPDLVRDTFGVSDPLTLGNVLFFVFQAENVSEKGISPHSDGARQVRTVVGESCREGGVGLEASWNEFGRAEEGGMVNGTSKLTENVVSNYGDRDRARSPCVHLPIDGALSSPVSPPSANAFLLSSDASPPSLLPSSSSPPLLFERDLPGLPSVL